MDTRANYSSHQLILEPSLGYIPMGRVLNPAAKDKSQKMSGFVSVLFLQGKRVGRSFIDRGNTQRHYSERAMSPYTRFREGQTLSKSPPPNVNCPLFRPSGEPQCDSPSEGRNCVELSKYRTTLVAAAINGVIYA